MFRLPDTHDVLSHSRLHHRLLMWSLTAAAHERAYGALMARLRQIEPEIILPVSGAKEYWELKKRLQHAFQCTLMRRALDRIPRRKTTVMDIGAAGTHMRYLRGLWNDERPFDTIEINLDPRAVGRIRERGGKAVLCRAEELHLHCAGEPVDLFTAFEMIEHLHDPSIFFHRLAKHFSCPLMVVTTPYCNKSRTGLFNVRQGRLKDITAEEEHIFELHPADWELLMLHAGWRVRYVEVCYQYPVRIPGVRQFLSRFWRTAEFEGFWGAILEKDTTFADHYKDWGE